MLLVDSAGFFEDFTGFARASKMTGSGVGGARLINRCTGGGLGGTLNEKGTMNSLSLIVLFVKLI